MKKQLIVIATIYALIFMCAVWDAVAISKYDYGYQRGLSDGKSQGYKSGWNLMADRASRTNHLLYDNFCKYIYDRDPNILPEGC